MVHVTAPKYRELLPQPYHAKSKIELTPVEITCNPNDIVVLVTPVVNCNDVLYRLHKPNGDIMRIDFTGPKSKHFKFYNNFNYQPERSNLIVKYINENVKTIYPKRTYKIINVYNTDDDIDVLKIEERQMNENDFMIGPLLEEDHGNWVLSIYCNDIDGEWIEMFQVITITLISSVPMENSEVIISEGGTFNLSFQYPIKGLETCELTVPQGSPDRYFDRNRIELDKCGYVVPNITKNDHGIWRVVGVGNIVYEGTVFLYVTDDKTPFNKLEGYDEYEKGINWKNQRQDGEKYNYL